MADTSAKLISQGLWLGIDIGSNRKKLFNFCLIRSDGKGQIEVFFEVGQARGAAHDEPFPPCEAGVFEDLGRSTWLSAAAEAGCLQVLRESALVKTWNASRENGLGCFGVYIDAPCGFAAPGFDRRDTETQSVDSFPTPPLKEFLEKMKKFGAERNHTPLCQRFYWKLVGLVAFRYFVWLTTSRPFDMPLDELTASCVTNGKARVRERFPSDTYKRSNGTVGVLCPRSRGVLQSLSQAKWAPQGNRVKGRTSAPHAARMSALLKHQQSLSEDLQRVDSHGGSILAMHKISNDPAWADLWDAFTCAFVSCCDAQGCGGFVCSDLARGHVEGAILRPDYCSCSPQAQSSAK